MAFHILSISSNHGKSRKDAKVAGTCYLKRCAHSAGPGSDDSMVSMFRWLRCLFSCVVLQVFGMIWCTCSVVFSLFKALVVKWDPGLKKLEKGSPNTPKKVSLFLKKTMFFLSRFFIDFMQCSGEAFLWFWWPKCPKWGAIGNTFPDILLQSWKVEMYGFVYTKHYFSWFLGVGFGNVGHLFSSGFLNWIRGFIFSICCEI